MKFTLAEIAHFFENRLSSHIEGNIPNGFAVDSRLLKSGDLFFALEGDVTNGHAFLDEVALKGACGAVVSESYEGKHGGFPLIRVPNPLESLQELARIYLEHSKATVIAITGSLGKTTTKDFLTRLLQTRYRVAATPGNSNSQIGLPLAILNSAQESPDVWVVEMGMTHPGNITELLKIAPPDIALITSVALVHAVNFDSLQGIAMAKGEILSHPKTRLGVIAKDIQDFALLENLGTCKKLSFTCNGLLHADYVLARTGNRIQINAFGESVSLPALTLPGGHNHHNFLAAAVVAYHLGISWDQIANTVSLLALPERRLQHVNKQGVLFVNDSYNASEMSVKAALNSLPSPHKGGRRIAVIGEMKELGTFSEQCHRAVAEKALENIDSMICFGTGCEPILETWKQAQKPVVLFTQFEELVAEVQRQTKAGDVVLLKGSRSNGLWRILELLHN